MRVALKVSIKSQEDKDKALSFFICSYLVLNAINSVLQDVLHFSGSRLSMTKMLITILMLLLLMRPLLKFKRSEWSRLILGECIILGAYLWSWLLGVSSTKITGWASTTMMVCLPIAISAAFISDKQILYNYLCRFSWIIWIVLIVNMRGSTEDLYDMHFSYGLLLVMLIHINELINTGKKKYILCLIVQFYMLVSYGSRGALVCIVVFLVLKVMTNVEGKTKRICYSFLIIAVSSGLYLLLTQYSSTLYAWLLNKGYYSRTLKLLLTGQFASHDSGRSELWNRVIELIKQKPILGWGIRGAVSKMGHPYPHNFFLDCWLSFGLPIGTIFSLILIIPIRKVVSATKGVYKDLMQILFSIGFVSLMFSSTYFTNYYYFFFMGLLLPYKIQIKKSE